MYNDSIKRLNISSAWPLRFHQLALLALWFHTSSSFVVPLVQLSRIQRSATRVQQHPQCTSRNMMMGSDDSDAHQQAKEALQSLGDFHEGSWKGTATSFTVTADAAAGIVQKKQSPVYSTSVQFAYNTSDKDLAMTELFSWEGSTATTVASRSISLTGSKFDVDAVDASYSLDTNLPELPVDLIGTDKALLFGVELCLAVSDHERVRCFALYGDDHSLARVVLCDEQRLKQQQNDALKPGSFTQGASMSASDLLEVQNDVDRLVDKISGQVKRQQPSGPTANGAISPSSSPAQLSKSSSDHDRLELLQQSLAELRSTGSSKTSPTDINGPSLARHPMSLLELSSGVWLGDSIIRDNPSVPSDNSVGDGRSSGRGFGARSTPSEKQAAPSFASWSVGVQKIAGKWCWEFGEAIRQVNDAGKALGAKAEPLLAQPISGSICENQSMSRRIPKDQRMVYIDWNDGNGDENVGFLIGSTSIQVPRFLTFGQTRKARQHKPFFTELCVYQREILPNDESNGSPPDLSEAFQVAEKVTELPEICCSRICRLYNVDGQLKQGCTSFFTLRRFGTDDY